MKKAIKKYKFIFDMDGTLYRFDKGAGSDFVSSQFYKDIKRNILKFLASEFKLTLEEAELEYEKIYKKYKGEISLGLEKEKGLDRYKYFREIWDLNPEDYIEKNDNLEKILEPFTNRAVLLTSAPKIWADKVLAYLKVTSIFGNNIYTGEPDLRKPNPLLFKKIADDLGYNPEAIISIGDQEETDIFPAKIIGMKTLLIGKKVPTISDMQSDTLSEAVIRLTKEGLL